MAKTRIVGIVLVRNEERYVAAAIRNTADFCDEILLCDHRSSDRTPQILEALAAQLPHARVHRINHPRESHELVRSLAGTKTWVFGVDGDEIYDPEGLRRMRLRIASREFDRSWALFGNVLNVTKLAPDRAQACGYLAPPCRSMTKLYNFAAIESWDGDCVERLHGGNPVFRRGFAAGDRRYLHEETPWEAADFRCLHLCFLPRSSTARGDSRRNIMETYGRAPSARLMIRLMDVLRLSRHSPWKNEKYRRGPEANVDVRPFFPDTETFA